MFGNCARKLFIVAIVLLASVVFAGNEIVQWKKVEGNWVKQIVDTNSDATAIAGDVGDHLFATGPSGTYFYYPIGASWMKMEVNDEHYLSMDTYRNVSTKMVGIRADGGFERVEFNSNQWQITAIPNSDPNNYVQVAAATVSTNAAIVLDSSGGILTWWADSPLVPADATGMNFEVIFSTDHVIAGGGVHLFLSGAGNTDFNWHDGSLDVSDKSYDSFAWNDEVNGAGTTAFALVSSEVGTPSEIDYLYHDGGFNTTEISDSNDGIVDLAAWSYDCFATDSSSTYLLDTADAITWTKLTVTDDSYQQLATPGFVEDEHELFALSYDVSTSSRANTPIPNPNNLDGAAANVVLSWNSGVGAVSHNVYIGEDEGTVADATITSPEFEGNQAGNSYDPENLIPGTIYYWRIDEVQADDSVVAGDVWVLSVSGYETLDDFEDYADTANLETIWSVAGGAVINLEEVVAMDRKSLKLDYDNTGAIVSEISFSPAVTDWRVKDAMSFGLWFRGVAGNSNEDLSVTFESNSGSQIQTLEYAIDNDDFSNDAWHERMIDYQDISVDLSNITKVTLSVGDGVSAGVGTIYIDNLGLFACRPGGLEADINGDCVVDINDIAAMAQNWLQIRAF